MTDLQSDASVCRAAEERLIEYGQYVRHPFAISSGLRSPFEKIARDWQFAIGGGGDGYDNIIIKGEAVRVRGDGGLGDLATQQAFELRIQIKVKEVHEAVVRMRSEQWRHLVYVTWINVVAGKDSAPERMGAEAMKITRDQYKLLKGRVLGYMEACLYSPPPVFTVLPSIPASLRR